MTPFKPGIKPGDKSVFHSPHTKPNQEKRKGGEAVTIITEAYIQNCNEAIQPGEYLSQNILMLVEVGRILIKENTLRPTVGRKVVVGTWK